MVNTIRIDALIKGHVWRIIATYDRTRAFLSDVSRRMWCGFHLTLPAIVDGFLYARLEAAFGIGRRAATLDPGRLRISWFDGELHGENHNAIRASQPLRYLTNIAITAAARSVAA